MTTSVTLSHVHQINHPETRRTKVVCTLGPSCWSVDGLVDLIDGGMSIARFNFSHGDHATHSACLQRLREAVSRRPNSHVAVMLDTKGPEIRTGVVDASLGGKLKLSKGEIIEVGTDYSRPCTSSYLACSYPSLPTSVRVGSKILVADGAVILEVLEILEFSVRARILNNASIGDKKNMNLPGAIVDLPTLTPKDIDDLVNFGLVYGVDFIAASFVRKPEDIDFIRSVLGEKGAHIKIISKIENQEGLANFDEILKKTDGIMVARGDLGMEIPIEKVFLAQKMMISKANLAGRPVITATQMLESMITNPRPTRAECSDVANAVLDGTDAVMLSGETANGEYPGAAVRMMAATCAEAESIIDYNAVTQGIRARTLAAIGSLTSMETVAFSASTIALDVGAKVIYVNSVDGNSVRLLAKYRPFTKVVVLATKPHVARQCSYLHNATCLLSEEICFRAAISAAKQAGDLAAGDSVVTICEDTMSVSVVVV